MCSNCPNCKGDFLHLQLLFPVGQEAVALLADERGCTELEEFGSFGGSHFECQTEIYKQDPCTSP